VLCFWSDFCSPRINKLSDFTLLDDLAAIFLVLSPFTSSHELNMTDPLRTDLFLVGPAGLVLKLRSGSSL